MTQAVSRANFLFLLRSRSGRSIQASRTIFDQGILRSDRPDLPVSSANVADHLVGRAAARYGDRPAVECVLTGQRSTYADLLEETKAYAAAFARLGLARGDVALISLSNGPLFPKVAFGLARLGATAALLNPMYTPFEMAKILRLTEAKAVVTQDFLLPNLLQAIQDMPDVKVFVDNYQGTDNPRVFPLSDLLKGDHLRVAADDVSDTTAFLPFSSGTTGPPKGVRLSHRTINSAADSQTDGVDVDHLRQGNGLLTIIPNFHIYGLLHVTSAMLAAGVKVMTLPVFDYGLFLRALRDKRPAGVTLVPPLAARLAADPEVTPDTLSSLRFASCGGAPLHPSVAEAFLAKTPPDLKLWMGYAMTECPSVAKEVYGQVGATGKLAANVRARFVDADTGENVGPGRKGEIYVQAPHLMQGYFKNPSATAEMFTDDGEWMKTGDVGYHDEEGNLFVVDRVKDLIKHKGFQVSPSELEEVILQVPGVAEVCVVGVSDERDGEVPKAFVVAKEGSALTESQIHALVNERLTSYKRLRGGVQFVGMLPTNPTGKVLRKALRN